MTDEERAAEERSYRLARIVAGVLSGALVGFVIFTDVPGVIVCGFVGLILGASIAD